MLTRAIRLTDEEAEAIRSFAEGAAEDEGEILRRAALRGLRELRLERAIENYNVHGDSTAAAEVAGMGRAEFLHHALDRGVQLLASPSSLRDDLSVLASEPGFERLRLALNRPEE